MQQRTRKELSKSAWECKMFARTEASRLQHDYIGTEHWLLGILNDKEDLTAGVLKSNGITSRTVKREIQRIMHPCQDTPALPLLKDSLKLQEVMNAAVNHAYYDQSADIQPIHIFLGMLDVPQCVAVQVVCNLGVCLDTLRGEVCRAVADGFVAPKEPHHQELTTIKRLLGKPAMTDKEAFGALIEMLERFTS